MATKTIGFSHGEEMGPVLALVDGVAKRTGRTRSAELCDFILCGLVWRFAELRDPVEDWLSVVSLADRVLDLQPDQDGKAAALELLKSLSLPAAETRALKAGSPDDVIARARGHVAVVAAKHSQVVTDKLQALGIKGDWALEVLRRRLLLDNMNLRSLLTF